MPFVSLSFPSGALLSAIIRNIVGACCWVACCLINRKRFLISAWVGLFRFIKSFNATLSAGGVSDAVAWLRTFQYRIIYANCNKCELFMKLYFLPLLSGATRYSHALLADNLCPFIRSCIFGFCHPRLVMKIQFFLRFQQNRHFIRGQKALEIRHPTNRPLWIKSDCDVTGHRSQLKFNADWFIRLSGEDFRLIPARLHLQKRPAKFAQISTIIEIQWNAIMRMGGGQLF